MNRMFRVLVAELTVPLALVAGVSAMVAAAPSASAEDNGVGLMPALGWSSWSFLRRDPTAVKIEAQAAR